VRKVRKALHVPLDKEFFEADNGWTGYNMSETGEKKRRRKKKCGR
jgi:hypothetical protein